MSTKTIFYSWQSDKPNPINRSFIERCLVKALKKIQSDETIEEAPRFDQATLGVPGAPDISATIFRKIAEADIFVADVTFVDDGSSNGRRFSNPNVLIELGFAASKLGWGKIVCVFNKAFGQIEQLPFDLRPRKIISYQLSDGDDKTQEQEKLTSVFASEIKAILEAPNEAELRKKRAYAHFAGELAPQIARVMVFGKEYQHRLGGPSFSELQTQYRLAADAFRTLARENAARSEGFDAKLEDLAKCADEFGNFRAYSGTAGRLQELIDRAIEKATLIKSEALDVTRVDPSDVLGQIDIMGRELSQLAARADGLLGQGRFDDVVSPAVRIGMGLLRVGYLPLDKLETGLAERVCKIGSDLHLLDTVDLNVRDGGARMQQIASTVKQSAGDLSSLLSEIADLKSTTS